MTAFVAIALAAALFENNDLGPALIFEDLGLNGSACDSRCTKLHFTALTDGKNILNRDGIAGLRVLEAIDKENVAFADGKLSSLSFDCGFHRKKRAGNETRIRIASAK